MPDKVLLLGNRRALPYAFPATMAENAGNMIHADAAFKIVQGGVLHTNDCPANANIVNFIEEECSHIVYIFANALRLGHMEPRQFAATVEFLESTTKPVVVFGLGAQADDLEAHADPLPDAAIRMLHLLSERSTSIGVRGAFTQRVLNHHGVDNVRVTGCPSLYTNLSPDFRIDQSIDRSDKDVAFAGTHFFREHEATLLGFAIAQGFQHIEPVSKLLYEAHNHLNKRTDDEPLDLPYFVLGLMKTTGLSEEASVHYLKRNFNMFWDTEAWKKFNSERIGFTYGTRFHVNMASLISGVPALWVTHDSRTRELTEFMALPHADITDAAAVTSLNELLAMTDYSAFNEAYPRLYANFKSYLNENGLPHNLQ